MSGLFGSETIITVQANTVQLIEKNDIPNTVTNSTMESIIDKRDIPLNILDDLVLGTNAKTKNYYRYGRKFYHYGLPSGSLRVTGVDNKVIKQHVESSTGKQVDILRVDIDHETGEMQLAVWLTNTYNLNPITLLISTYPTKVSNALNHMSNESINNYNQIIAGIKNNLINQYNFENVVVSNEGNRTVTTTTKREAIITDTVNINETRSAFLGNLNQTSNPDYKSVNLIYWWRLDSKREATYSYDVWYTLDTEFLTTFTINYVDTVTIETVTQNEDGSVSESKNVNSTIHNITITNSFNYEDSGLWTGTKKETWEVTFTRSRDGETGRIINTENTNTYFIIYYYVPSENRNRILVRNYNSYKSTFTGTSTSSIGGNYYPIVPIRRDNKDLTRRAVRSGNAYKTSKRLMNRLGVSLTDIAKAINENPNVRDIDHAYFMLGIPIWETDKVAARYFFEFFNIIYNTRQATNTPSSPLGGFLSTRLRRGYAGNIFSIADAGLRIEIGFGSIQRESILGNIGPIGFSRVIHNPSITTVDGEFGNVRTTYGGTMTIQKQIEVNTYQELRVTQLNYKNYVYQNHTVDANYYDAINKEDENFILPLFLPAVNKMSLIQRDRLLYMAPHLVLNSYEKQKVKWYQSGFFGFLLQVVALAIAIKTGGLAGFAVGMTASALAIMLIKKILISIVFNFAFKLVAKALGEEFAMLMALALAAYGMTKHAQGLGNTFFDIPKAELFTQASTSLIQGVQTNIQKDFENLVDTATRFAENMKNQMEELEKINKELDGSNIIDPNIFINSMQPYTRWGESPDDYFNRTVHAGNPGIASIDAVSSFVDIMLRLPEIEDTILEDEEPEYV